MSFTVKSRLWGPDIMALLLFTVFLFPLGAIDADLGVGIGVINANYPSEGELPDFADYVSYKGDLPTIWLEAALPISEKLKLSAKLYPHSRYLRYLNNHNRNLKLRDVYLDLPFTLMARMGKLEFGGGAGLGFNITDNGVKDEIGVDDIEPLPALIPSFNLTARLRLNEKETNFLELQYLQDLVPMSDYEGHKVSHNRLLVSLSHRYKNMSPREDLVATEKLTRHLKGFKFNVGAGGQLMFIGTSRDITAWVDDYKPKYALWFPTVEIQQKVHPYFELHTGISTNSRAFSLRELGYYTRKFSLDADYIDIPLQVRTRLHNVEFGGGLNLSVLTSARYTRQGSFSPQNQPYEAAKVIPAAAMHLRLGLKDVSLNFAYSEDLVPFSTNYGTRKYQQQLRTYFSYHLFGSEPLKDLLPPDLLKLQTPEDRGFVGIKPSYWGGSAKFMPVIAFEHSRVFPSGFRFGHKFTSAALRTTYNDGSILSLTDLGYQPRFGYRRSFVELWAAPGVSLASGIAINTNSYLLPIFPIILPKISMEAGLRVHVLHRLSIDLSWEQFSHPGMFLIIMEVNKEFFRLNGVPVLGMSYRF